MKLANNQKNALEEKQRVVQKLREKAQVSHTPIYFDYTENVTKNSTHYRFNGKYWKDREDHNWAHLPDIFGERVPKNIHEI